MTPSEIISTYIGEAADNVATVFEVARENEPCLVFVDEIDAIASDRSGRMATSEQQMVNQLLTELESQDDADIVVFAATNYLDDVDDAILRSGRFDERIEVPPPDRRARLEILRLELADAPSVLVLDDVDELAPASGGSRATKRIASRLESLLPTLPDEVLVVGTARSIDGVTVDVLHAGAFDERIEVPPPNDETRIAILENAVSAGFLAPSVDVDAVADATAGFSIRDVRHLAGRVARDAIRREKQITTDRLVSEADEIKATLQQWDEAGFEGVPKLLTDGPGGSG